MNGLPDYNPENELSDIGVPAEGLYDVSLIAAEHKVARTGKNMMLAEFVIDNDPKEIGAKLEDMFVFMGKPDGFGERKLQRFANRFLTDDGALNPTDTYKGGYTYKAGLAGWQEFCAQFVQIPPLRIRVKVKHTFDVEQVDGTWKNKCTRAEFDAAKAEGSKAYVEASAPSNLKEVSKGAFANQSAAQTSFPGTGQAVAGFAGDGGSGNVVPNQAPEGVAPF
jgi:hypothetical protein